MTYNKHNYEGFQRTYKRIVKVYYIRYFIKRFKRYILYYSKYQINQIKRYVFYKSLKLIPTLSLIFYIIIINFILALSLFENKFNITIIVIDKFFKKMISAFEKI